jgi:predicted O-linked N-acetylglucosamine transferase (SPINDLY family)
MADLSLAQTFDLALKHHQAGRLKEADQIYQQILAVQPDHPAALHYSGTVALQSGRLDEAIHLIRRALAIYPTAAAWSDLGVALNSKGFISDAIDAQRKAIALKPDYAVARSNLGNSLRDIGRLSDAIAAYRQAIALKPQFAQAQTNLGVALAESGDIDGAIASHRAAIAIHPHRPGDYNTLGNLLRTKGQLDDAIATYRHAIAIQPNFATAYCNLGAALGKKGQIDEALVAYRRAIELKPDFALAHSNLGDALKDIGQLDDAVAEFRRAVELEPGNAALHSNLVYILHLHPDYDAYALASEHAEWNARHALPLRNVIRAHTNDRTSNRPLRIGYISPDFRAHPVGRFLLPLFASHDKQNFQIFCYAKMIQADPITDRLRSHAHAWRPILGQSDDNFADLIRKDQIDILVDLTMHMSGNSLLVFARKPAPVQVTYLAYCSTTGLAAIDYRISDPHLDPPGINESVYSEKTIRLPETYWCYEPIITPPQIVSAPALARRYVTFGCLSNICKVSPKNLATWIDLLRAVPNSRLILSLYEGAYRDRLHEHFELSGVKRDRIQFVPKVSIPEYFASYNNIDIALDTFPYAGGTTTCDALWMGVPVVTLAGKTTVGRGGVSILTNVGLPDLIARTSDEYIRIAADLAANSTRLADLRATLRSRLEKSPLMDAVCFARNFEAAYRQMWRNWCGAPT